MSIRVHGEAGQRERGSRFVGQLRASNIKQLAASSKVRDPDQRNSKQNAASSERGARWTTWGSSDKSKRRSGEECVGEKSGQNPPSGRMRDSKLFN